MNPTRSLRHLITTATVCAVLMPAPFAAAQTTRPAPLILRAVGLAETDMKILGVKPAGEAW